MEARHSLKIPELLAQSATFYVVNAPTFLRILLIPAFAISFVAIGLISSILGFSTSGSAIDPTVFQFSISRSQWLFVGAGVLAMAVVFSLSMAGSVHATLQRGNAGIRIAFRAIRAKSMQIFWLQCVIYALALRFSPWTVLLFWLLAAFAIPAALRENLGPGDAMDRAWEVSRGRRLSILVVELVLLVPPVAATLLGGWLEGPGGPISQLSPVLRAASSWLAMLVLLAPLQFMFVALAWIYQALAAGPEAPLHARGASNVSL